MSASGRLPAATNRRARHSMSEDRTPSGRWTDMRFERSRSFQIAWFVLRCAVWQVGHRRRPAATNRVARHSMSEDRAPSRGVRFASETNTQMSSGSGLKRLYYKAFAEAKPLALSQRWRNDADRICRNDRNRLGRPKARLGD